MQRLDLPADLELGRRRARAAALLTLALPGGAYVYQGEELGLPEVEDLPDGRAPGPDLGARRPHRPWPRRLPRAAAVVRRRAAVRLQPGRRTAAPWLPQPADWAGLTAEAETGDPGSMLELYREALRLRRQTPALGDGGLTWLDLPEGALGFTREPGFACVVNVTGTHVALPDGYDILLTSDDLGAEGRLPAATSAWLIRH